MNPSPIFSLQESMIRLVASLDRLTEKLAMAGTSITPEVQAQVSVINGVCERLAELSGSL